MDVPKKNSIDPIEKKQGSELISELVELTALPAGESAMDTTMVEDELTAILEKAGCQKEDVTLDELRAALITYLESLQDQFHPQEVSGSDAPDLS